MELTGKANIDFEKYLYTFTDCLGYLSNSTECCIEQDLSDIFDELPESMQHALIIDWFDSVGWIDDHINIQTLLWLEYSTHGGGISLKDRTKKAIIKADQIYNETFNSNP